MLISYSRYAKIYLIDEINCQKLIKYVQNENLEYHMKNIFSFLEQFTIH